MLTNKALFRANRILLRPWVAPLKPVWFVKGFSRFLDGVLGFLACVGFRKIPINNHVQADILLEENLGDRPVILYLHGGAFMVHLPNSYRSLVRKLSIVCGADIVMPDYRLAPKYKFPTGLEDCLESYQYLLDLNIDPQKIILAGDSAGGNFTLSVLLELKRQGLPLPKCAIAIAPVADVSIPLQFQPEDFDSEHYFSEKTGPALKDIYLKGGEDLTDSRLSPLYGDWSEMPPVLLQASIGEFLEDDAKKMAAAIEAAGTEVQLSLWPDVPHVFHLLNGLPEAKAAIKEIGAFVKQKVGGHHEE